MNVIVEELAKTTNVMGNFREISGKCPGNFRDISGKIPGKFRVFFREICGKFPGHFREISGKTYFSDFWRVRIFVLKAWEASSFHSSNSLPTRTSSNVLPTIAPSPLPSQQNCTGWPVSSCDVQT